MKSLKQYILEFQGWPDWDDVDDIPSPEKAAELIKKQPDFQKHGYNYWYNAMDPKECMGLWEYLTDDELELEDKEILAASLELTGMLSKDTSGFEFTEPIKDTKLTLYTDDIGDDNTSIIYAYSAWNCPKEFLDFKKNGQEYVYVYSNELDSKDFEKRHDKLPKHGLMWAFCAGGYSGTVGGYWCKDKLAKEDMMKYCGLIEFKKGKIVK